MKLVVMIPAYNEEETIGSVIKEIPRDCYEKVELLVIDDGSVDNTVKEAERAGADKIISFKRNKGLAPAFRAGLETALEMDADIIVNTDADGQYNGKEIPKLIKPIIEGKADFVLGSRFRGSIEYMPIHKKVTNRIATFATRQVSRLPISDAQTGFRAFTSDAAFHLNVMSNYTYVQETLMQAANYGLVIAEIPIEFRKRKGGESRLISNIFGYASRAGGTMVRTYRDYQPLKTFSYLGLFFIVFGLILGFRVFIHYLNTGMVGPYLPSAVLTVLLLIVGIQTIVLGLLADMLRTHRRIQDEILYRLKKMGRDNKRKEK
jgi:glycosyltransferase involved in cell wall biosynthesis